MKLRKLDDAARARLVALFRLKLGPPPANKARMHWRRTRCGLTTAELTKAGWDVEQLRTAHWIQLMRDNSTIAMGRPDVKPLWVWTPHGPVYAQLFNEQLKPSGVFSEVRHGIFPSLKVGSGSNPSTRHWWSAPSGWRYDDPHKGTMFLDAIRRLIDALRSKSPKMAATAKARFLKK